MRGARRVAAFVGVVCATAAALAQAPRAPQPAFQRPALMTSVGQSSDIVVAKAVLNTQLKLELVVDPLAPAGEIAKYKTLVIVVGASVKGLATAGVDIPKETARAKELVAAARTRKVPILLLHTGGESRRDPATNDLLTLLGPSAAQMVCLASGNRDKVFNTLAAPLEIPVVEAERLADLGAAVKAAFGR